MLPRLPPATLAVGRCEAAMLKLIAAILSALLLALPAAAQDLQKGIEAYERGDYAAALKEWRPLAEQGLAAAQYNLGLIYANGQGVKQDYAEAVKWYRRAAEQGDAEAQNNLGVMYEKGQGVKQDHAEAVKWYRLAAEQGYAAAQNNLGVSYELGSGVRQDYVQAHLWYNLAASSQKEAEKRDRAARNRDRIAAKMPPQQVAEAQRLAREWKPK